MAVFNPGDPGLLPGFAQIQNALSQRADLESRRKSPLLAAGTSAFDTLKQVNDQKREEVKTMAKEQRERDFQMKKMEEEQKGDMVKESFKAKLQENLEKMKLAAQAKQDAVRQAHERRGERFYSPDKVRALEDQMGMEPGSLQSIEGTSLTDKDLKDAFKGAATHMVAKIKAEPGKDAKVSSFSGKADQPATFGDTQQFATQTQRLNRQVVTAGGDTAMKDISQQQFPGTASERLTPAHIKGAVMLKMINGGYEKLSPEEKMAIDTEVKDPAMDKAIRIYAATNPIAAQPEEAHQAVTNIANQLRDDATDRAMADTLLQKLTPKQKALVDQNVTNAVDSINAGESKDQILNALQAHDSKSYPLIKKQIEEKLLQQTKRK